MKKIFSLMLSILFLFSVNIYSQDVEEVEVLVEHNNMQESESIEETEEEITEQNTEQDGSEIRIVPEDKIEQTEVITPSQVKGVHLTTRAAASSFHKARIDDLLDTTELNTVVIDVKEIDGEISIKNVYGDLAYSKKLPSVEKYLKDIKNRGFYAIARIVVFRDNVMPRKKPELAVKNPDGTLWEDYRKFTWLNPYKQEAADYILELAEKTADLGFDEIQFDYIRFPSDGRTKQCRYGVQHSPAAASNAITDFLKQAKERLSERGVKISIDVFGLTTTEKSDMGIGQKIVDMTKYVDYVSPMIYPSHYANGQYGIPVPNKEPYRTVYISLQGAKKRLPVEKLRPWLQDFSLRGVKYGPEEIKAQIQACFDCGVKTWILWNAACKYTKGGLKTKQEKNSYKRTSDEKIKELLKYESAEEAAVKKTLPKQNTNNKNTNAIKNTNTKNTNTKTNVKTNTKTNAKNRQQK